MYSRTLAILCLAACVARVSAQQPPNTIASTIGPFWAASQTCLAGSGQWETTANRSSPIGEKSKKKAGDGGGGLSAASTLDPTPHRSLFILALVLSLYGHTPRNAAAATFTATTATCMYL